MPLGIHDHPFYKPKWRRQAIVASAALWAIFEVLVAKDGMLTGIAVATWAYCLWAFLLNWKDPS
jgi:hypothetical protein